MEHVTRCRVRVSSSRSGGGDSSSSSSSSSSSISISSSNSCCCCCCNSNSNSSNNILLNMNTKNQRKKTIDFVKMILGQMNGDDAEVDVRNCIICNKKGLFLCCNSIYYCSKEHQRDDWKLHKAICLKRKPALVMDDLAVALDDVAENKKVILSMAMVHEILEYIHIDFRHVLHRDDDGHVKDKLSIEIILRSHMQDYFAGVLLSQTFRKKVCNLAIQAGSLHSLIWAKLNHCPIDFPAAIYAGAFGNLEICKFVLNVVKQPKLVLIMSMTSQASRAGHLNIIKYFVEQKAMLEFYSICSAAASGGAINIIKYAVSIGKKFDSRVYHVAARGGYIDILEYAFSIGCCNLDTETCSSAAAENQLEALQWARAHGCEWDYKSCYEAICGILRNFGTETLYYLIENGCPMEGVMTNEDEDEVAVPKIFNLMMFAISQKKFRIAKHALMYGCPCADEGLRNFLTNLPDDTDDADVRVEFVGNVDDPDAPININANDNNDNIV